MSRANFVNPDPQPSATRIAFVRVPPPSRPCVAPAETGGAAGELARFLAGLDRPRPAQFSQADRSRLTWLFDRSAVTT